MSRVTVQGYEYTNEQPPIGFVTLTTIDSEHMLYGLFANVEEAIVFGRNLVNATIVPVYRPSLH